MDVSFVVPTVPVAQPRQRVRVICGHASTYTPRNDPVQAFKASVRAAFAAAWQGAPASGPVQMWLTFLLPRPGRLRWKKRPMPRCWCPSKPDADNLTKSFVDALQSLCFHDDSQLVWLNVQKLYAAGHEQPHVEVRILSEVVSDEPSKA